MMAVFDQLSSGKGFIGGYVVIFEVVIKFLFLDHLCRVFITATVHHRHTNARVNGPATRPALAPTRSKLAN